MTEQILITIPMAVYNGMEFLHRAIQSVLSQSSDNWELICVDDGSTDCSLEILEGYAKLDRRIKIIHQKNSGPARARMQAYRASKGGYVFTGLDQDDYLDRDFVKVLSDSALNSCADVILCDWLVEKKPGQFTSFNSERGLKPGKILSGVEAFELTFPWKIHAIGLWSRRLVDEFAVKDVYAFNSYDSDEYLARVILLAADTVFIGSGKNYHCLNQLSMTSKSSLRKTQSLETNERLIELARSHGLSEKIVWKIIIYQRNYLANIFKMLGSGTKIMTKTEDFNQALYVCREHFSRFKEEARQTSAKAGEKKRKVEWIILKLTLRYLVMQASQYFNQAKKLVQVGLISRVVN